MGDMTPKLFAMIGICFACTGVILGAFGAHLLKTRMTEAYLAIYETAVRYQMYHALGLIGISALLFHFNQPLIEVGAWGLILGTCIFSGSLYILVLSGVKSWGVVTPFGGLFLVIGWLLILIGLCKYSL